MPHTASRLPDWARPWRRRLLLLVLGSALAGLAVLVGALAWLAPQLPALDPVLRYQPRQHLQVFTADGVEIAQFGAERRQFVPIEQMPELLKQAVLAVEDARFYRHPGIDPKGLARALWAQATGGLRQGASTITQQVARTFFLSHRFTPERKLKEALLALDIERRLPKDRILELYMNQIFLGQRAYGFAAAAQTYLGKTLDQLTLAETAMLAGLPQNPYYANPVVNPRRAQLRQRIVLARMVATGVITEAQAEAARAEPLRLRPDEATGIHAESVAEMARQAVVERFGAEAYSQGLRVHTTIRSAEQAAAWQAVQQGLLEHDARQPWRGPEGQEPLPAGPAEAVERAALEALKNYPDHDWLRAAVVLKASPQRLDAMLATGERVVLQGAALERVAAVLATARPEPGLAVRAGSVLRLIALAGGAGWRVTQWPEAEAALVALDPASGRVMALVGGFDPQRQPFNHATQAWRQPGSAFKPFLYSAALEAGVSPDTVVNDAPRAVGPDGWAPENDDGSYDGPISLRLALARSRNLVSVRLLEAIGIQPALDWASRFGFDRARLPDNLTLALGTGATTPLRMAAAYAVLANGGWRVDPVVIERITDAQGRVLFQAPPAPPHAEDQRVVPARNVFITNSLLNDVTRYGTAARAQQQLKRRDLYGKTGTTNDAVDAWFAGFQPQRVAVVWVGHGQPKSLGAHESGSRTALPIWIRYMAEALQGVPLAPEPPPPEGLVRVDDDWRYAENTAGRGLGSIGVPPPPQIDVTPEVVLPAHWPPTLPDLQAPALVLPAAPARPVPAPAAASGP